MEVILTDDDELEVVECDSCREDIVTPYPPREYREGVYKCSVCDAADKLAFKRARLAEDHARPDLPPPICVCGHTLDRCHAGTCNGRRTPQMDLFR